MSERDQPGKPALLSSLEISMRVNGKDCRAVVEPRLLLSDFIRHGLGFTGTRIGCEQGVCGACTVILDGAAVRSCLIFAIQADGAEIRTVEGLAPSEDKLGVLQQAFREKHALQCGYCTAGMLTTLTVFLEETPNPTAAEVREAISGNLCRCTGYQNIVAATLLAASRLRNPGSKSDD